MAEETPKVTDENHEVSDENDANKSSNTTESNVQYFDVS
jgi:hypothetical protein